MSRINSQRKNTCSVFSAGTELKLHSAGEALLQSLCIGHTSLREVGVIQRPSASYPEHTDSFLPSFPKAIHWAVKHLA